MNSFQLKIAACLLMLIDHLGVIYFPEFIFFRIIGRLSFPLFAYLITVGYTNTRDVKKYLARMFIFFLISQPFYFFAFHLKEVNIFGTLFLGLVAIFFFDKIKNKTAGFLLVILIGIVAELAGFDYGFYGILTIFIFKIYDKNSNFKFCLIGQSSLTLLVICYSYSLYLFGLAGFGIISCLKIFALLSLIIIKFYNGQRGPSFKYAFYSFYPAHLLILGVSRYFIG